MHAQLFYINIPLRAMKELSEYISYACLSQDRVRPFVELWYGISILNPKPSRYLSLDCWVSSDDF